MSATISPESEKSEDVEEHNVDENPGAYSASMDDLIREIYMESSPEPESQSVAMDYINGLTDECLLRIFSLLNKIDLCQCSLACRRWRTISNDKSLWKIVNFAPLTFNIGDTQFNLLASSRMKSTQKLYLGSILVSFKMLKSINQHCKYIHTLVFGRNSSIESKEQDQQLPRKILFPKRIQTLDLRMASGDFEFLNETGHNFQHIYNLGIGTNSFNTVALNVFFTKLPNLQTVDFTNCLQIDDIAIEVLANNCPNITSLCLIGCRMVYGTTFSILLDKCRQVKTLLLRYLKLDDDIVAQNIWDECLIEELDISACPRLTWHGLLQFLVQLKHLTYLNMSYCGEGNAVNDGVLYAMAEAGHTGNLKMLDLRWSFYVTPEALETFLTKSSQLEYLGIYQSFHIFSQHVTELVKHLPCLKILEFGSSYPEELSFSNIIPQLILKAKYLQVLSLINFTATQTKLAYKYLKMFMKRCKQLHRINFCDCSHDLVKIGKQAVKRKKHVNVTVKWECALPPPSNTLDAIISI